MNGCDFSTFNGVNKDCEAFLTSTKGGAFTSPEFTFASLTTAKSFSNWKAGMDTSLLMWVGRKFKTIEVTPAEPVIETDGMGNDTVTRWIAPKITIYMSANPCDYVELMKLDGQPIRFIPFGSKGEKMLTVTKTGILKGFSAQMVVAPMPIIGQENVNQQFKIMLNFNNVDEFTSINLFNDGITNDEYLEMMPEGYTLISNGALSTASQPVKIYKRCKESTLGVDTFTSEILEHNLTTTPTVTVGAITAGLSTLTIYATGTTPLASGQWVKFRLVKKTAAVYDEITNALTVSVA